MAKFFLGIIFILLSFYSYSQNFLGLGTPTNKGRFPTNSGIKQSSGLALDPSGANSYWTHNDQGNPLNILYKFSPTTGNINVILEDSVVVSGTINYDWEDLAKDKLGNLFICQTGKNCTPNGDPIECPGRFVYKIHKVKFSDLNAGLGEVIPQTFYFKYPKTGYEINNCSANDTVFVNAEAAIWFKNRLYIFTKDIWSKNTNNCGGWQQGYTYLFKVNLLGGSTEANPLVAEYVSKFNLKVLPTDLAPQYQVTGAAISPDSTILALCTYGRVWHFRNFIDDHFFANTVNYFDYSLDGINPLTRSYEGIEFKNNSVITLSVDNQNGRISEIDLDQITLGVTNTNDDGPGSLRMALRSTTAGDTLRFTPFVINSTINLTSGPLIFQQNICINQPNTDIVKIASATNQNLLTIDQNSTAILKNLELYCANVAADKGIINYGNLFIENITVNNNSNIGVLLKNFGNINVNGKLIFSQN